MQPFSLPHKVLGAAVLATVLLFPFDLELKLLDLILRGAKKLRKRKAKIMSKKNSKKGKSGGQEVAMATAMSTSGPDEVEVVTRGIGTMVLEDTNESGNARNANSTVVVTDSASKERFISYNQRFANIVDSRKKQGQRVAPTVGIPDQWRVAIDSATTAANKEAEKASKTAADADKKLNKAHADISQLQRDLGQLKDKLGRFVADNERQQKEIGDLKQSLDKRNAELAEEKEEKKGLQNLIKDLEVESNELRGNLDNERDAKRDLENKLRDADRQNKVIEAEMRQTITTYGTTVQQQQDDHDEELRLLQEAIANIRDDFRTALEKKKDELDQLYQNKDKKFQDEKEEYVKAKEGQLKQLQDREAQGQIQIEDLRVQNAKLKGDLDNAEKAKADLVKMTENQEKTLKENKDRINNLEKEHMDLKTKTITELDLNPEFNVYDRLLQVEEKRIQMDQVALADINNN